MLVFTGVQAQSWSIDDHRTPSSAVLNREKVRFVTIQTALIADMQRKVENVRARAFKEEVNQRLRVEMTELRVVKFEAGPQGWHRNDQIAPSATNVAKNEGCYWNNASTIAR